MSAKTILLFIILFLKSSIILSQPNVWTGGGADQEWTTPLNWSLFHSPTLTEDAVLLIPTTITISTTASANSITVGPNVTLVVDGTTSYTIAFNVLPDGEVEWKSGFITGAGPVVNEGKITIKDASPKVLLGGVGIENDGEVIIDNSVGFSINAGGSVDNNGLFLFKDSGSLLINSGGTFNNNGVIEFRKDGASILGVAELNNNNIIVKTQGNGENEIGTFLNNSGHNIEVVTGKIKLKGGGKLDNSNFILNPGTAIEFDDKTYELTGQLNASNTGTVKLNEATLKIETFGILNFTGTTFQWSDGKINGGGVLTIPNGTNALISGNDRKDLIGPTTILNQGLLTMTNAGDLFLINDAKIQNENIFEFAQDLCDIFGGVSAPFTNTGILRKTGGAGLNEVRTILYNENGTLECQSGLIRFTRGGDLTDGTYNAFLGAEINFDLLNFYPYGELTGSPIGDVIFSTPIIVESGDTAIFNFTNEGIKLASDGLYGGGILQNNGILQLIGSVVKIITQGSTLYNTNLCTISGGGDFVISSFGYLKNSGFIHFLDDQSDLLAGGSNINPRQLINLGTIKKTGGMGISKVTQYLINLDGTIDAQNGSIELAGAGNMNGGVFTAAQNATVNFTNGSFILAGHFSGSPTGDVLKSTGFNVPDSAYFDFQNNGFNWVKGALTGPGTLENDGLLVFSSTNSKDISNNIHILNNGMLEHRDNCTLIFFNANKITNNGTYDFVHDGDIGSSFGTQNKFFHNYGTLKKSGGSDVSLLTGVIQVSNFNGQIESYNGKLNLNNSTLIDGSYFADTNAILEFSGSVYLSGELTGHPLGDIYTKASNRVDSTATLSFGGNGFQWSGGSILGGGILTNDGHFHLVDATTKVISQATTIINNQLMTHQNGGALQFFNDHVKVINYGVFDVRDDSDLTSSFGISGKELINYGILKKSTGTGVSSFGREVQLTNLGGQVEVSSGTLQLFGGNQLMGGYYNR